MELRLIRNRYDSAAGYTIGRFYIDQCGYFCDTLEDEDRGLHQDMPLPQIKARKVKGQTAIPKGRYRVQVRVSPKFRERYWCRQFGGKLPYLQDVPGFDSVAIHVGNFPEDTDGCLLVGVKHSGIAGRLFDSALAFQDLMQFYIIPAHERKEAIWITIE